MNEQEFIRQQVATERAHMGATRAALAAALGANYSDDVLETFARAAARYLGFIVRRFNAQDLEHCAILQARVAATDQADRAILSDLAATLRFSGQAIDALAAAVDAPAAELLAACGAYNRFYTEVLGSRRHAIYHLFERHYGIVEWRQASFVDADSILEERELYAAVASALPAGLELRSPARPTNKQGP